MVRAGSGCIRMIHEAKIEYTVVAEYADGNKYCIAKFMHEEDGSRYLSSRKRRKVDYVSWKLYRRTEKYSGEITWEEL